MSSSFESTETGTGLRQYLEVLRRRRWLVLGILLAAIAAAVAVSTLQSKVYRATAKIVIGQGNGLLQPQFGNAFQPFTATAKNLIESKVVAVQVIDNLKLEDTTPEDLLADIGVSINPETAVLEISVTNTDRVQARRIAQELSESFSTLFNQQFGRAAPVAQGQTRVEPLTSTIWDPARVEPEPVSPRPVRNVVVAAFLGLVLGLIAAYLREHFDRGLRTREEVEAAFGLPVVGQIPSVRPRGGEERPVAWSGVGEMSEAFRALRANLQYVAVKRPLRSILVTSASPEQGKTTVTANLSLAIARSGATTIVLEGDLRRPRLEEAFRLAGEGPGLTSVLVGAASLEDAIVEVPLNEGEAGSSIRGKIDLIPSGPIPPNPTELLSSLQMTTLLDRVGVSYDYVLVDSPPLLLVADAIELARSVDGVLLVVRRGKASTDEARELRSTVERLGINLVGVVFTDAPSLGTYGTYGEAPDSPKLRAAPTPGPAAMPAAVRGDVDEL